jgi:hypothetical protein
VKKLLKPHRLQPLLLLTSLLPRLDKLHLRLLLLQTLTRSNL